MIKKEELWKEQAHPGLYIVTTNQTLKNDGSLVMGRGAALQAKERIPGIALEAGRVILEWQSKHGQDIPYGFKIVRPPRPFEGLFGFGILQVKWQYFEGATTQLIACSMGMLINYCLSNPEVNVRMNRPGTGYGRLTVKEVAPLLKNSPKNLTICYK